MFEKCFEGGKCDQNIALFCTITRNEKILLQSQLAYFQKICKYNLHIIFLPSIFLIFNEPFEYFE